MSSSSTKSALLGAAFLMATSAIGPGFITQTTVFTQQLLTSFGFVILISILLDIAGQLNIWRVITVSGMRAQDLANNLLPGSGFFLAALVVLGGMAFNIGNVAGAGMGLDILFPLDADPTRPVTGACLSAALALVIFWVKEAGKAMDWFTKVLGFVMIGLTLYVAIASHPPAGEAALRTFVPTQINTTAIVTLVGGTVGGYISFAGAHRLLDAGIRGQDKLPQVTRSSVSAILLASAMRILLFLASLGVIASGGILNPDNPAGSVFQLAAGQTGYYIFGIVLWAASITSVVGSAYTSISFLRTFHPFLEKNYRMLTTIFIVFSAFIFAMMGKPPVKVLVLAGALNGLILPFALALMLLAVYKQKLVGKYRHPLWMSSMGWLVVAVMTWMGVRTIIGDLGKLW
ncbi:MAG: NRAMP family divalent metal transporter [Pseudobacter sp.]|uniref:NRAMP family divalent metal transporter n=1 Tax=Pseudobacter sp. TaxID=2045420 RepID=UPI003F7F4692